MFLTQCCFLPSSSPCCFRKGLALLCFTALDEESLISLLPCSSETDRLFPLFMDYSDNIHRSLSNDYFQPPFLLMNIYFYCFLHPCNLPKGSFFSSCSPAPLLCHSLLPFPLLSSPLLPSLFGCSGGSSSDGGAWLGWLNRGEGSQVPRGSQQRLVEFG